MKKLILKSVFLACMVLGIAVMTSCDSTPKVTVTEDEQTYTLDNGIVRVMVAKASGDLVSLRYQDKEMLATFLTPEGLPDLEKDPPGENLEGVNRGMTDHQYGFWSHDAMGKRGTGDATATITIDPSKNGGKIAEVSIKGISGGRKMGTGPGVSREDGQFISDIEIRYTLQRGASGVYTYCIFDHPAAYGETMLGEARFCVKLNDFFDWMSISENHNFHYPKDYNAGDKYVYTMNQDQNRAFGWSSTTENVGLFFINPSMEYMSGGPTKVEFLGHRDTNQIAAPCVLNYWRSSHYGGSQVNVAAGEKWSKVIGPFLIYVNSGLDNNALYEDAKAQIATESAKWPFTWVNEANYTPAEGRTTVKGQLVLSDEQAKTTELPNLKVGLTHAAWTWPRGDDRPPLVVDWQQDAKFYQFWTNAHADGTFEIPHVIPGSYTLHAFADGVLGEFARADVTVAAGQPLDLGQLTWTPVRKGTQLWEVGTPNRYATEFFMSDQYNKMNIAQEYPTHFPNDVTFTIGQSEVGKDWFFQHVPHYDPSVPVVDRQLPNGRILRGPAQGKATPYTVKFDLASAPKGTATLRFGITGSAAPYMDIAVNGKEAGRIVNTIREGAIARHGSHGLWHEDELAFNAGLLQNGANTLTITVPAGAVDDGMMYDYIRLELDETATL